jgi:Protein of unknown function (DUF3277)
MSSGITRKYAPDDVAIVVGTQPVTGVKSGTFVEVDRAVDTAELDVGSDGEVTLIISPNQSGTMKITVQQSSPINDYLTTLFQALQAKQLSNAVVAFTLNDKNGNTICSAQQSVVKKPAKVTFADKTEGWEWTLLTGYLSIAPGSQASVTG